MTRLRLGALALGVLLLAGSCSALPGGGGGYQVTVYFPRAVSVFESSQVKVLGLPAGTVSSVEVVDDQVKIVLTIDDGVPVPADATAAIVPQSLIGERYVQLFPAWTEGDERMEDGAVIPLERSTVPVEPDEALKALKEFLDTLDPEGAGRLVENAADALEGNGEKLGEAITGLADLQTTLASEDDTLVRIVDQLDDFAATLVEREGELGEAMEMFAEVTGALAAERRSIEQLVEGLATTSTAGLDLVSKNSTQLRTDLARLTKVVRTVEANLGAVDQLLSTSDDFPSNLNNAYNAEHRRIDLRTSFSPVATEGLDTVPGLPPAICLPIDVQCDPAPVNPGAVTGRSAGAPVVADVHGSRTAADVVLGLVRPTKVLEERDEPAPSFAGRVADGIGRVGGWVRTGAAALLGIGS